MGGRRRVFESWHGEGIRGGRESRVGHSRTRGRMGEKVCAGGGLERFGDVVI